MVQQHDDMEQASSETVDCQVRHLFRRYSSTTRLAGLLDLLDGSAYFEEPATFWSIFHQVWSSCDATWEHGRRAIQQLERAGHCGEFLGCEDKKFYSALPEQVKVYRGCSRARVKGMSWTTDMAVAEDFAQGHRGIQVPRPVLAKAVIYKGDILTVSSHRGEAEVLLNPNALAGLSVRPFAKRA
ncbi:MULTISPECIES: hypothetical protein [unclassified Mesorhizobium]|uniref:hypothetical protein n=1 Tax=unclassified Mesorhizobium TaxID=325217 RepID=UPI001093BF19|nr:MULTISPECIES: hypothetical protein [unclassified Mesorhizobium]TGQ72968.1 hypothetical protein EN848_06500 [bacterium M00.F.Ca.ET.205.01.1.1]TGU53724.1 hypothetical protein EN795_10920 [bacterium M00.F.Ca.ET.152.01.1.1]TGV37224.1 hypothetical protein EN829_010945 [Mesorhizobium sp. M00.F.Ca.ET.186.01.1.1]TGZ39408.1 hypothetical protein EN805_29070 [bacterium M00.F.Ca.ET.162.01.1.1]TGT92135.1 hypothetical protein EN804_03535 [Mesorhizobium sp. M8A.F.Ca.ET.161.01.1.1]